MENRGMPVASDRNSIIDTNYTSADSVATMELVPKQNESVSVYGPMVSKFDVVRYLIMQLPEKFDGDSTIQKLTESTLLKALNHDDGHTSQLPIVDQNTYMELLQANRPYSLMDIVNLNFDNDASNWKFSFETAKGTKYHVEKFDSELQIVIAKATARTSIRTVVGKDDSYITMIDEKLNDKGEVVSRACDVNRYDHDGHQLPVSNRFDEIRYSLIAAEWEQNPQETLDSYEMIDPEHNLNDRYSFVNPISLEHFYEKFKDLILPAGNYLDFSKPDSRLVDNMARFINLSYRIEDQLGSDGDVLLSEALVEPISTHFGVVDATPFEANGLAIVKNPNHQYTMVTINVSYEDGKYSVSSYKQDAAIDDVIHSLNHSFNNAQLEGITEFTDGRKVEPSLELRIPPVSRVAYREPLLPNASDFLEDA